MKGKKMGTGKIHGGKPMHMKSAGGKDKMAHESHRAANKEFGMGQGMAPEEGYQEGESGDNGGMHENESCCD